MSRYRLQNPDKLFRFLGILVVILLALILVTKISKSRKSTSADGTDSSSYSPVETFTIDSGVIENLGTTRSVSTIPLESIGNQLAVYMSSVLMAGQDNVKTSMALYLEENDDPLIDYDPSLYKYIIAINPDCGGTDEGTVVGSYEEKDITLDVAQQLVEYLNEHNDGYYFFLTREDDTTMAEGQRLSKAASYSADMLITLRCDSSDEERGGTVATYYSKEYEWDQVWHNDSEVLDITDEQKTRDELSEDLAQQLMDAAAEGFDMWSRYIEEVDEPMTDNAYISCVVYLGYMTYDYDLNLMTDKSKQASAAEAMGKVILEFLDDSCDLRTPVEKTESVTELGVDGLDPSRTGSSDGSTLNSSSPSDEDADSDSEE